MVPIVMIILLALIANYLLNRGVSIKTEWLRCSTTPIPTTYLNICMLNVY
jgi:hypothetical protein